MERPIAWFIGAMFVALFADCACPARGQQPKELPNQITPEARATLVINPNDFVGGALSAIYATQTPGGGAFGPVPLFPDFKRPDAVNNAWTMPGFVKSSGHNLTIKWQATDSLSGVPFSRSGTTKLLPSARPAATGQPWRIGNG